MNFFRMRHLVLNNGKPRNFYLLVTYSSSFGTDYTLVPYKGHVRGNRDFSRRKRVTGVVSPDVTSRHSETPSDSRRLGEGDRVGRGPTRGLIKAPKTLQLGSKLPRSPLDSLTTIKK